MIGFASLSRLTASKLVQRNTSEKSALFFQQIPHRCIMSQDDGFDNKPLSLWDDLTSGLKIEIEHSSDPIHQKTLACLKESIKVYKKKQLLFRESIPEMKRRKKLLDLDASELKLLNKGAEKLEEHLLQPTNLGLTKVYSNTISPSNRRDSWSIEELRKTDLLRMWSMMNFNSNHQHQPSDSSALDELNYLKGHRSVIQLRDLFSCFYVTLADLSDPYLIELEQYEWKKKGYELAQICKNAGDDDDKPDLDMFSCDMLLDLTIKRGYFRSFFEKKGIDDFKDLTRVGAFAEEWSKVSSFKMGPSGGIYFTRIDETSSDDDNTIVSQSADSSKLPTFKNVSSEIMLANSRKLADYLFKFSS